jgi:hypothetical protein
MMFNSRCRLELGKVYCLQLLISMFLFELLINLRKLKYILLEHKKIYINKKLQSKRNILSDSNICFGEI